MNYTSSQNANRQHLNAYHKDLCTKKAYLGVSFNYLGSDKCQGKKHAIVLKTVSEQLKKK